MLPHIQLTQMFLTSVAHHSHRWGGEDEDASAEEG